MLAYHLDQRSDDPAAVLGAVEKPEERVVSSGDIEGMAADERSGRLVGEATIKDAERLGE